MSARPEYLTIPVGVVGISCNITATMKTEKMLLLTAQGGKDVELFASGG